MYTARFTEVHNPLTQEYSDSIAVGGHNSSWVYAGNYHRLVLVVNVGDMGNSATLDVLLRQATTSSGTSAKTISGKSITQLTQASGDSNSLVAIELQTEELDVTNGFDYVQVRTVVGTNPVEYGWVLYGLIPRFKPTGTTAWTEVVT